MPRDGAPELAIGYGLESHTLLTEDRLVDEPVLEVSKGVLGKRALPRGPELRRSE
jgi:hypothetical protein